MSTSTQPKRIQRITLRQGKITRRLVLVEPPFVKIGDICSISGSDWEVTKAREELEAHVYSLRFPAAKARQEFPRANAPKGKR